MLKSPAEFCETGQDWAGFAESGHLLESAGCNVRRISSTLTVLPVFLAIYIVLLQIVHPDGYISGLLSAKPYISLSASTFVNTITADGSGKGYRAIIQYNEDVSHTLYSLTNDELIREKYSPGYPNRSSWWKVSSMKRMAA